MRILILLFAGCFLINVYKTYNIFPVVDLNVQVSGITLYLDRRFSLRNKYAISKSKWHMLMHFTKKLKIKQ